MLLIYVLGVLLYVMCNFMSVFHVNINRKFEFDLGNDMYKEMGKRMG